MARSDQSDAARDPSRREFFRTFSRQTVRQAGAVVGAAEELRRTSLAAARQLFEGDAVATPQPASEVIDVTSAASTFHSPSRFTDGQLVIQDARALPGRVTTVTLAEPSEVASAIRAGAINAGPVLAQVAAYTMVLAARRAAERPQLGRHQQMRAAAATLRAARREVRALHWAVDRMESRYDDLVDEDADEQALVAALTAEADAIADAATEAHLAIGRYGAALSWPPGDGPINLLMHGDAGPLSCGLVGMGTALLQALADAGRAVHTFVTDGGPAHEGSRLTVSQMRQAELPHTLVPDAAVGWLFDHHPIAAVVLRGDLVCANGDSATLIGGLGVARLAGAAGVPTLVLAPRISIDLATPNGAALPPGQALAAAPSALNPAFDVVPADLIGAIVTDAGVLSAPYERSFAEVA